MLDRAFYETLDFRTLVESSDRPVVVGRRGTGKSALLYRLGQFWRDTSTRVATLSPDEDQIIALRPLVAEFGGEFRRIRAGSRLAWRYALMIEVAQQVMLHYKYSQGSASSLLARHRAAWLDGGSNCTARLRSTLKRSLTAPTAEERIGQLSQVLEIDAVEEALRAALDHTAAQTALLVDRLDEGYEADGPGIGLVAGLVQATIDIKTRFAGGIRPILFLRDNMFRTVAQLDPDYSRNIEGHVLRLHWDEQQLFNMVCNRLRIAFDLEVESNRKAWDRCTAPDLHGFDGFRQCLRYTLYRPRDILALLNEAFFVGARQNSDQITKAHLEATSKDISINRLDDLRKEYSVIVPALALFTAAFANATPEVTVASAGEWLADVISSDRAEASVQQDLAIHGDVEGVLRTLYSVGFLGVYDAATQGFVFCHDGTMSNLELRQDTRLLVHPCYWMALNLGAPGLGDEGTQQINDEYGVTVTSAAPEVRLARIGTLLARLGEIDLGSTAQGHFEEWTLKAIQVAFGGHLRNLELHPNGGAVQRRDVVGTNLGESANWRRILADYGTRQAMFEVKNYQEVTREDYRQILSYLTPEYGRLAFVVSRDDSVEPRKGLELDWIREIYHGHGKLVVKLTAKWLHKLLSRVRSPERHDVADVQLGNLLDAYQRIYIGGEKSTRARRYAKRRPR